MVSMAPPNEERRPTSAKVEAASDRAGNLKSGSTVARCRVCGHRLWAKRSVSEGIGPECRRRAGVSHETPDEQVGSVSHLRPNDPLPPPRPTPLAWTAFYLAAHLREELPKLRLHLLTMEERADLERALVAAVTAMDTAIDASDVRGGWSA